MEPKGVKSNFFREDLSKTLNHNNNGNNENTANIVNVGEEESETNINRNIIAMSDTDNTSDSSLDGVVEGENDTNFEE